MPFLAPRRAASLDAFRGSVFTLQRPWFSLRDTYRVLGASGELAGRIEIPWFRFTEEMVLYQDDECLEPLLLLRRRNLLGGVIWHDVLDAGSGARLGCLRGEFNWVGLGRDRWQILGPDEQPAGELVELGNLFVRRLFRFAPSEYELTLGGEPSARLRRRIGTFRSEYELVLLPSQIPVEPRFAIACCLLAIFADRGRNRRSR